MPIANSNSPRGFRLYRSGGQAEPKRTVRHVNGGRAKDLMIGDAYTLDVDMTALRATLNTDVIKGIVEGIILAPVPTYPADSISQDFIANSDAGDIIGIEDSQAEFEVMATTIADPDDRGKSLAIVDVDGDRPLRQSRQSVVLDAGNHQFTNMGLVDSPADNAAGAFARIVVRLFTTEQVS